MILRNYKVEEADGLACSFCLTRMPRGFAALKTDRGEVLCSPTCADLLESDDQACMEHEARLGEELFGDRD